MATEAKLPERRTARPKDERSKCDDGIPSPSWQFWKRRRYVVCFMAFCGFCNVLMLRANVSVAVAAMTSEREVLSDNGTLIMEAEFEWDMRLQGLVLGSYYYGYITTQILGGWLAARFGGHLPFGFGIAVTAALTLLTPTLARISVYWFIAIRVTEGIFEGVSYPSMHEVWANWAPPLERTRLATIAFCGSFYGSVIAMTLSGFLAQNTGWPSVFYVFGAIGIVWYITWCIIVRRSPEEDRYIDRRELKYIQESLGRNNQPPKTISHPWSKMFLSLPVWAITVANFTENWGLHTFLTELPTFMKDALGFDVQQSGFLSALPYLALAIVIPITGFLSDWIMMRNVLTVTQVRKLFCCAAFSFQAVFLLLVGFLDSPEGVVTCLTLAVGLGGLAEGGFMVNHLDIAPQHASVLMGISNTAGTLPGIVSPNLIGYLVSNKTKDEWRVVFYIASGVYLCGTIFYGVFASGDKQKWAEVKPTVEEPENTISDGGGSTN